MEQTSIDPGTWISPSLEVCFVNQTTNFMGQTTYTYQSEEITFCSSLSPEQIQILSIETRCTCIKQNHLGTFFKPLNPIARFRIPFETPLSNSTAKQFLIFDRKFRPGMDYRITGFFYPRDSHHEYFSLVKCEPLETVPETYKKTIKTIKSLLPVFQTEPEYSDLKIALLNLIQRYDLNIKL